MLTVKDISQYLHIGINQAYELVKTKGFPCFKVGQKYLIPEDEFQKWIKSQISNKEW